jgi:putative transposase
MNQIYRYIGYSKQSFHQKMDRQLQETEQAMLLLPIIEELRQEHPGVSARKLYLILKPQNMGRDKFVSFCFEHGYKLDKIKSYKRTTNSTGVIRFPNLLAARELTGINQAWSSDITYYQIGDVYFYITFIIDLFSRKIVGYSVSKRLLTEETTLPALQMALKTRKPSLGLIFHSDGGGQYYSKAFLKLTSEYKISNSMCDIVFENAHAERINGTIKNQYLKGYAPRCYQTLVSQTARAVNNYNQVRPHDSLGQKTPAEVERMPAGGTLSSDDVFCDSSNSLQQHQKRNHLPTRKNLYLLTS